MSENQKEISCLRCEGAGTLPDKGAPFGVKLCDSCNGHGVVVEHFHYISKYDPDGVYAKLLASPSPSKAVN
jgi:DnaJ-class molecular chaperone